MRAFLVFFLFICLSFAILVPSSFGFQSDELLVDDEEFGLEGGRSPVPVRTRSQPSAPPSVRRRSSDFGGGSGGSDSDSKIQFSLEHAFGDSDFSPAGTFSARLKTSNHGAQVLYDSASDLGLGFFFFWCRRIVSVRLDFLGPSFNVNLGILSLTFSFVFLAIQFFLFQNSD